MTENYDILHRFHDYGYGGERREVVHHKYRVTKRTPQGAWIMLTEWGHEKRFVLLTARKQFACETEKEAMNSFIRRKTIQAGIYQMRADAATDAIQTVKYLYERSIQEDSPVSGVRTITPTSLRVIRQSTARLPRIQSL